MNDKANKLAEAHWGYIKETLDVHGIDIDIIIMIGYHYKTAMIHGYKHGMEDCKNDNNIK